MGSTSVSVNPIYVCACVRMSVKRAKICFERAGEWHWILGMNISTLRFVNIVRGFDIIQCSFFLMKLKDDHDFTTLSICAHSDYQDSEQCV